MFDAILENTSSVLHVSVQTLLLFLINYFLSIEIFYN